MTASWMGGGIACAVLVVLLAAAAPALLRYQPQPYPDDGIATLQR